MNMRISLNKIVAQKKSHIFQKNKYIFQKMWHFFRKRQKSFFRLHIYPKRSTLLPIIFHPLSLPFPLPSGGPGVGVGPFILRSPGCRTRTRCRDAGRCRKCRARAALSGAP